MSTRGKENQIDNIEFNVLDIARSKAFYGAAFGWTFVDYGPAYTEFTDGRLTGGFAMGDPVRHRRALGHFVRRRPGAGGGQDPQCRRQHQPRRLFLPRWKPLSLYRSGWVRAGRVVCGCQL